MPIVRWAFDVRQSLSLENVEPLVTLLIDGDNDKRIVPVLNLLNYLPESESDSLLQIRLEDGMRRALVARLMLFAFFTAYHKCRWEDLTFDKSKSTKPVLLSPEHLVNVSFNISHHGDWVVLVGETETCAGSPVLLGVDVVNFQGPHLREPSETLSSYIQDQQFTPKEMSFMAEAPEESSPSSNESQLERTRRPWCLNGSIVKALDAPSDFVLKSIEFTIQDEEETEKPIHSTVIEVRESKPGLPEEGWSFEEALLDENHRYAIAAQSVAEKTIFDGSEIRRLDWKELLKDAVPYPDRTSPTSS
ncbi:hypothetical protein BGZ80_011800 [Entomortierella chlamydospora]|uniref:holo-[acyl-carrier-protein] synthase n=1 Tax=Entomortierella chlamydospora TaxID=101097 RepID=A0A9P6MSZ8_9FUNG|nr:hypothetical protein BGZ79_010819 [Entomortierella chlamydospora]KAG0012354.1 hypothetical protein BGZ80_011800 [Entomortierella chlamydospora]